MARINVGAVGLMRVFISWSGDLSRRVAEVLRQYLPLMIQGVEAFMSKHDLESGTRWSLKLAKELEMSSFGILCLTPDNLDSNWMLFEAGALTKHVEGRACGLLIGGLKPTDVSGPLSQFQNRSFARDEVEVLLRDINATSEKPLMPPQLDTIFEKWWSDIQSAYNAALEGTDGISKRIPRGQRDLIEEILTRIRAIEGAIERKSICSSEPTVQGHPEPPSELIGIIQKVRRNFPALSQEAVSSIVNALAEKNRPLAIDLARRETSSSVNRLLKNSPMPSAMEP